MASCTDSFSFVEGPQVIGHRWSKLAAGGWLPLSVVFGQPMTFKGPDSHCCSPVRAEGQMRIGGNLVGSTPSGIVSSGAASAGTAVLR